MNYQNGKIYKIESHVGPKIYSGSTTKQYLSQRMEKHRSGYNRWKLNKKNKECHTLKIAFSKLDMENKRNVKIIEDENERSRGFGYVEFE